MLTRLWLVLPAVAAILFALHLTTPTTACCTVAKSGTPVVNADQTVVILWDKDTKTEQFIRQASFKSDAEARRRGKGNSCSRLRSVLPCLRVASSLPPQSTW